MSKPAIYLDYNATTPLKPAARTAMLAAMDIVGNPSSIHTFGRAARTVVEDARTTIAHAVGVRPAQVVFTSGGSESVHLALCGKPAMPVAVSAVEHAAGLAARADTHIIPVDHNGIVRLDALESLLKTIGQPALVSVMVANNETGVLQPITDIAAITHAAGGLLHCDAVQAFGKIPVNMLLLGADMLSLSAHKMGGPKGVGALVLQDNIGIEPLLRGGGQEQNRRSGTPNVVGIAGFGAAASTIADDMLAYGHCRHWRDTMEERILANTNAVVYGAAANRLPNTSCIGMPGVSSETQLMAFDLAGIAVSAGSACSSGKVKPSHVLQAMGADDSAAMQSVRISSGFATQAGEADAMVVAWRELYERKQAA
jgi:cysteine desulfurase